MTAGFEIAGRPIGPEHSPLFLPDIATFFDKDVAMAKKMIARLKDAGAEVVKAEVLHNADICLDDDTEERYFAAERKQFVTERYRDLIERKTLSLQDYEEIFQTCRALGLPFIVSVYDFAGASFARDAGAAALKIASSNIVHEPLIRHAAKLGLPLIVDTGRSTVMEIARAVEWARDAGAQHLVVEHSPVPPPAPVEQQNLRFMQTLARSFDCLVGLSDHHAGPEMLYAASALGASVIEKAVCRDDNPDDQDVAHALPIGDFGAVARACQTIWSGLGTGAIPAVSEKKKSRMGLIAQRDLNAGTILTTECVGFAFPAKGIPVEHWSLVTGWRMRRDLRGGAPINWSDVEPLAS